MPVRGSQFLIGVHLLLRRAFLYIPYSSAVSNRHPVNISFLGSACKLLPDIFQISNTPPSFFLFNLFAMKRAEAIQLLQPAGIDNSTTQRWADLGSGEYQFTHALAGLLAKGSSIYAVDRIGMPPEKGDVNIIPVKADFEMDELALEPVDGILMANSLHYVAEPFTFLQKIQPLFKNQPLYLIVEYDTEVPIPVWVPYPVPFRRLEALAQQMGYAEVARLGTYDSRYGGTMYAAVVRG